MSCRSMLARTAVALAIASAASSASAQTIGTFRWNLAPFCNDVNLTITQTPLGYSGAGFDDVCGGTPVPVNAIFTVSGGSSVQGSFSEVLADGSSIFTSLQLSLSGLNGTWNDSSGNSGPLVFNQAFTSGGPRQTARELWAYVISNAGLHATSGGITVTHPATGEYCVVIAKRSSWKAAQVTLADPGGTSIMSAGTGHGSACNPLSTATNDAIPVYAKTPAGAAVDANFLIVIPMR